MFGIWKYFADRDEAVSAASRKESLGVIRLYSSGELIDARESLLKFWENQHEFSSYISTADKISKNEYFAFVKYIFPRSADDDRLKHALFQLNDYFDTAYHCRTATICDAGILDNFLCKKADKLYRIYEPFYAVLNRQISSHEFGESLKSYSEVCRSSLS